MLNIYSKKKKKPNYNGDPHKDRSHYDTAAVYWLKDLAKMKGPYKVKVDL